MPCQNENPLSIRLCRGMTAAEFQILEWISRIEMKTGIIISSK